MGRDGGDERFTGHPRLFPVPTPKESHQFPVGMDRCDVIFTLVLLEGILSVLEVMQEEECGNFVFLDIGFHTHQSISVCHRSAIICQDAIRLHLTVSLS